MIAKISGVVTEIEGNSLIIENNGIGFEILVAHPEKYALGLKCFFYVFEQWKEDSVTLFGFAERSEKEFFELMIRKVNGIGAKTALNILSKMRFDDLLNNIKKGNFTAFKSIPGIGEKTAKRIVLDLGGDISSFESAGLSDKRSQVSEALEALGFSRDGIYSVVKDLDESLPVEEMIREGIKKLAND